MCYYNEVQNDKQLQNKKFPLSVKLVDAYFHFHVLLFYCIFHESYVIFKTCYLLKTEPVPQLQTHYSIRKTNNLILNDKKQKIHLLMNQIICSVLYFQPNSNGSNNSKKNY